MRECINEVTIEGILSENNLRYSTYTKEGREVEAISGDVKIRLEQVINGETKEIEIPVYFFTNKITKAGKQSVAYDSLETVMKEYISIAASDIDRADRIRINGTGRLSENVYFLENGNKIESPRIQAQFITRVRKENYKPEATFAAEFVVTEKGYVLDKDGIETSDYSLLGAVVGYNDRLDLLKFTANSPNVINVVSSYWDVGDTVRAQGKLNFSQEVKLISQDVDFGEPIVRKETKKTTQLLITGGSQTPLEGELAYNPEDVRQAMKARLYNLEKKRESDMAKAKKKAPSQGQANPYTGF